MCSTRVGHGNVEGEVELVLLHLVHVPDLARPHSALRVRGRIKRVSDSDGVVDERVESPILREKLGWKYRVGVLRIRLIRKVDA
jgi:hypothetical protein